MTKRRIAVAVATLFLGAHAGIAALESEAASAVPAVAEQHAAEYQLARAEVTERAEPSAAAEQPEAAESAEASGAPESPGQSASAETAEAAAQPAPEVVAGAAPEAAAQPQAAQQPPAAASTPAAPEQPMSWWDRVRAAFASFFEQVRTVMAMASTTPAPTFPDGDGSSAWHLPATVAYLDQVEQERAAAIQTAATESSYPDGSGGALSQIVSAITLAARSESAFPMGSDDSAWREPMPAEIAYFEQLDRERLAAESGVQTAQADTETAVR